MFFYTTVAAIVVVLQRLNNTSNVSNHFCCCNEANKNHSKQNKNIHYIGKKYSKLKWHKMNYESKCLPCHCDSRKCSLAPSILPKRRRSHLTSILGRHKCRGRPKFLSPVLKWKQKQKQLQRLSPILLTFIAQ